MDKDNVEDEARPKFRRKKAENQPKKIHLMCKFYAHGYKCIRRLRNKLCRCVHCPIVRKAYRKYEEAEENNLVLTRATIEGIVGENLDGNRQKIR